MIHANLVELQLDAGWKPSFILIGPPDDFQIMLDKLSGHSSGLIHHTRWRRLKSHEELMEYVDRGCQVRSKNWDGDSPIDWS